MRIHYKFIFLFFFLQIALLSFSQREADIWYFGENAGLSFKSGRPLTLTNGKLSTLSGSSSMCSPDGKLLFYTDGYEIYDSTHKKMPNSKDERINSNFNVSQSALIAPLPDSSGIYYLFTIEVYLLNSYSANMLYYTIIDMKLNKGKGDVRIGSKRIPLLIYSSRRLCGIRHANGKDYWIISDKLQNDSNNFSDSIYAWQLTSTGLNSPIITKTGFKTHSGGDGIMKISSDGNKIAFGNTYLDTFLIADFNSSNGKVNNIWLVNQEQNFRGTFSVEFSEMNNYLYISQVLKGKISQYDLKAKSKKELISSRVLIDSIPYNARRQLQRGPDGKIYVGELKDSFLNVIHAPDSAGFKCRFRKKALYLSGKRTLFGLPNFITTFLKKYNPTITYTQSCANDTTRFSINDYNYPDSVKWDFGDTFSIINSITTKSTYASHIYSKSGIYKVRLYLYYSGIVNIENQDLIIDKPKVNFIFVDVCSGDSAVFVNLSTPKNDMTFNWKFGDGTQSALPSPKHLFPIISNSITYNVTLVAKLNGSCSDSVTKAITINDKPNSNFIYTVVGLNIDLKAMEPNYGSYWWKIGSKDSFFTNNGILTYTMNNSDHDLVCLKATNLAACSSATCKNVSLDVKNLVQTSFINIYPNPNNGEFTLNIGNGPKDGAIVIYNYLGKEVYKVEINALKNDNLIDLKVEDGIYFIIYNSKSLNTNKTLFIQN